MNKPPREFTYISSPRLADLEKKFRDQFYESSHHDGHLNFKQSGEPHLHTRENARRKKLIDKGVLKPC